MPTSKLHAGGRRAAMSSLKQKRNSSDALGASGVVADPPAAQLKEEPSTVAGRKRKIRKDAAGGNASIGTKATSISKATAAVVSGSMEPDSNWKQLQAVFYPHRPFKRRKPTPAVEPTDTEKETGLAAEAAKSQALTPVNSDFSTTKQIAMDCEMVGVGHEGTRNALARVTLVNAWGNVIYDKHVRPLETVTDFRTKISGVRRADLKKAVKFSIVQQEVANLLSGRILVGHALHNDLKVLFLSHPRKDLRDTTLYKPLRSPTGRPQSLQHLAAQFLGTTIQEGEHDPVEDARAAMMLYQRFKAEWERSITERKSRNFTRVVKQEK